MMWQETIKDWNGMHLTEAEDIKKRRQEYTEELYKKDQNHNQEIYTDITMKYHYLLKLLTYKSW